MLYSKMFESVNQANSSGVHDLAVKIPSVGLVAAIEEPSVRNVMQKPAGSVEILTTRLPVKWQARQDYFCTIWTREWQNALTVALLFTKFLDAITWHAIAAIRSGVGFAEWSPKTTVHILVQDLYLDALVCKTSLSSSHFGFFACSYSYYSHHLSS